MTERPCRRCVVATVHPFNHPHWHHKKMSERDIHDGEVEILFAQVHPLRIATEVERSFPGRHANGDEASFA
jgi:hypothetical protein